jgi:hypothetical protein
VVSIINTGNRNVAALAPLDANRLHVKSIYIRCARQGTA